MAATLAEKYAALANTAPVLRDPEEDINSETVARVAEKYEEEDSDLYFGASQLRQRTSKLLADEDSRYSGRRISRKALQDDSGDKDDSDMEATSDSSYSDVDEEEELDGEDDIEGYKALLTKNNREQGVTGIAKPDYGVSEDEYSEGSDDDNEEDGDIQGNNKTFDEEEEEGDDDDDDEDGDDDDDDDEDGETYKDTIQKFSHINIDQETEKGKAVQTQLGLWDHLLECRIKMQKMLSLSNCLPQHDMWPSFLQQGDEEYQCIVSKNAKTVKKVLEKLLLIQERVLAMNPETSQLAKGQHGKAPAPESTFNSPSDEEIPSDTDEEVQERADTQESTLTGKTGNRKRKLLDKDIPALLDKRRSSFLHYRNSTIQKWNDKTRLASGKVGQKNFSAFDQSAVKQIEQICSDKERLRKRTQLKRSTYKVLGKEYSEREDKEAIPNPAEDFTSAQDKSIRNDHLKDYDTEIFDDDDFYHQLLRELIERKTADTKDPIAISRQWLEIQKLRGKIKKKVDTKASKGRKIRFDVHQKLVNFMAPIDHHEMTDEAKDELFRSLFGSQSFSVS